jgi:hypothetical protein
MASPVSICARLERKAVHWILTILLWMGPLRFVWIGLADTVLE